MSMLLGLVPGSVSPVGGGLRGPCRLAGRLLLAGWCTLGVASPSALIPLPAAITPGQGVFRIQADTALRVTAGDAAEARTAEYFLALVARSRGLALKVQSGSDGRHAVTLRRQPGLAAEGYQLVITPLGITITASTDAGLFYGAVTLWQLLPAGRGAADIPALRITDQPAYPWRGLMLDSARHMQSVPFIRSMIDWMAWHKLNVLHWHLTDDQGWRLEIRKYPRLCAVGGWRVPASLEPPSTSASGGVAQHYGGCYSQEEIREVVAYAASRHVTIVPEIDLPGHAQAAIAAYPKLGSLAGPPPPVSARWGVHTYLYNVEPDTFSFLEDVLSEVIELFPGEAIHIGGDEAVKDQWRASAQVQARAQALGINDMDALQGYFTQRIGQFLKARGRRAVGWDEILRPELATDAIVMSWRGTAGAHAAAIAGNDTVLSPWPTLYFDNRQSPLPGEPPGRTRVVSLQDVYRFEPHDATLSAAQQRHILGVQANLWTEHIRTEPRLEWMALPRAAAVAEVGWSLPERRHWPDFLARLAAAMPRYRSMGLHVADSVFAIDAHIVPAPGGYAVTFTSQGGYGEIRFTTDGREPTAASNRYTTAVSVAPGTELRARTFDGAIPLSLTWSRTLTPQSFARRSSRELGLCSDGVGLLLEPPGAPADNRTILALDIMNPCWIYHDADLSRGAHLTAAAVPLPFNFELGKDVNGIRRGDAHTPNGELEIRIDGCDTPPAVAIALPPSAAAATLGAVALAPMPGRHELCLRFARPVLEPMWALDWVEVGE
jgi:hexosaminidase